VRLKDRVAIVTGAGGVIGRVIAMRLAEEGAKVVAVDLKPDAARKTVEMIEQSGGTGMALEVDITKKSAVQDMARRILETEHAGRAPAFP